MTRHCQILLSLALSIALVFYNKDRPARQLQSAGSIICLLALAELSSSHMQLCGAVQVLIGHSLGGKVVMSMAEQFGLRGTTLPRPVQAGPLAAAYVVKQLLPQAGHVMLDDWVLSEARISTFLLVMSYPREVHMISSMCHQVSVIRTSRWPERMASLSDCDLWLVAYGTVQSSTAC